MNVNEEILDKVEKIIQIPRQNYLYKNGIKFYVKLQNKNGNNIKIYHNLVKNFIKTKEKFLRIIWKNEFNKQKYNPNFPESFESFVSVDKVLKKYGNKSIKVTISISLLNYIKLHQMDSNISKTITTILKDALCNDKCVKSYESGRKIFQIFEYPKLTYYPKLWAERPKPIEGESLSSWMIRTSLSNLSSLQDLLSNLKYKSHYIDLDLQLKPEIINLFVGKTGISEEDFREMSYVKLINNLNKFQEKTSLRILSKLCFTSGYKQSNNSLRYCPLCLKEDKIPYFRKIWRLSYISFCPIHNCFLEKECSVCKSSIAPHLLEWDSNFINCFKCGNDLTETTIEYIHHEDPLLKSTKDFIKNSSNESINKMLFLVWFLAKHFHIFILFFYIIF